MKWTGIAIVALVLSLQLLSHSIQRALEVKA